jgi:hypothetical protein
MDDRDSRRRPLVSADSARRPLPAWMRSLPRRVPSNGSLGGASRLSGFRRPAARERLPPRLQPSDCCGHLRLLCEAPTIAPVQHSGRIGHARSATREGEIARPYPGRPASRGPDPRQPRSGRPARAPRAPPAKPVRVPQTIVMAPLVAMRFLALQPAWHLALVVVRRRSSWCRNQLDKLGVTRSRPMSRAPSRRRMMSFRRPSQGILCRRGVVDVRVMRFAVSSASWAFSSVAPTPIPPPRPRAPLRPVVVRTAVRQSRCGG